MDSGLKSYKSRGMLPKVKGAAAMGTFLNRQNGIMVSLLSLELSRGPGGKASCRCYRGNSSIVAVTMLINDGDSHYTLTAFVSLSVIF